MWRHWRRYVGDRQRFRQLPEAGLMPWGRELPMLGEWDAASGGSGGYFLQDLTVARWIHREHPRRHVDIGSRIDGFIGHLAVFRSVEVLDIRPAPAEIPGVVFHQLDLMEPLADAWTACTDSLSCLHTIEHFGLGRYGDPLDATGHLKGLKQLMGMVAPGGRLYLSVPIGGERVEFNAHRIFSPATLLDWFDDGGWQVEQCAWIDDDRRLHEVTGDLEACRLTMPDCDHGIGIIAARKR